MTRDLGRVGGSQAGRQAARWTGGLFACLLLAIATPSAAVDEFAVVVNSYAECVTAYKARGMTDYAAYCRKRFPLTVREAAARSATRSAILTSPAATSPAARPPVAATSPAAAPPATTTPTPAATAPPPAYTPTTPLATSTQTPTATPSATRKPREPVDITPAVNRLIESWANRPRTPKPPPGRPADPLAVIPDIQAACAAYAGDAARWRRCTSDAWKTAGLRGQPPVVLQVPPAPPPPVYEPPPPVRPEPPVQSRPPPPPPPSQPPPVVQPEPPVAAVTPPPAPPPTVAAPPTPTPEPPPAPTPPSIPSWAWWLAALAALVVAAAGGFGLAKLLNRARPKPSRAPRPEVAAACEPAEVVLVVDPGVVALIPDGSPRAGMAVSMRFALDVSADEVRLDYPSLETAP